MFTNIKMNFLTICLLAVIQLSDQRSTPEADTYRAAVVEFAPEKLHDMQSTVKKNGEKCIEFIEEAAAQAVDIIVFPEVALPTFFATQRGYTNDWPSLLPVDYNPSIEDHVPVNPVLIDISQAAKKAEIYVVINISEKELCDGEGCPEDGQFIYNSQAIFDRSGKIIAKYRKSYMWAEEAINSPKTPEVVMFKTDFNVTFGTFICNDIMFKVPALTLTRIHNITDIVFSTYWFSQLPFLTANQIQAGWAYAEDANLLAAGTNIPSQTTSGSGIYLGRKGIAKATIGETGSQLLIADVPKKNRKSSNANMAEPLSIEDTMGKDHEEEESTDNFRTMQDRNIVTFPTNLATSYPMEPIQSHHQLCQNEFCCDFSIKTSNVDPKTRYELVAVFANMSAEFVIEYQACGIVLCTDEKPESCATQGTSETMFTDVTISTTFHNPDNYLIMPSSINSSYMPLDWIYNEQIEDDKIHIEAVLNKPAKNVLTLGIYARKFDRDFQ